MGLLYTTEGTRRIIDTLNTAFDGPAKGLDHIRTAASPGSQLRKKIEKRNWKPGHLARMLKLLPYDQGNSAGPPGQLKNRDTKRWHWFLKNVVGTSATFGPIRNALADAILNRDSSGTELHIVRVAFDHVELAGSANPNVVIYDAPLPGIAGGNVRNITLYTVPVPEIQEGSPFDPKDSDEPDPLPRPPWEKG